MKESKEQEMIEAKILRKKLEESRSISREEVKDLGNVIDKFLDQDDKELKEPGDFTKDIKLLTPISEMQRRKEVVENKIFEEFQLKLIDGIANSKSGSCSISSDNKLSEGIMNSLIKWSEAQGYGMSFQHGFIRISAFHYKDVKNPKERYKKIR